MLCLILGHIVKKKDYFMYTGASMGISTIHEQYSFIRLYMLKIFDLDKDTY